MNEMFVSFFGSGIWAVIKAVLLLLLAFITAAVVKSFVVKLFTKTKLSALLKQSDSADGTEKSVDFIGKLVHLLVFLLFVPGIFLILSPIYWPHWLSLSLASWLQNFREILWKV